MSLDTILFLIFASLGIRFLLQLCGQRWITTLAHTSTLTILPIITFVITKVISGNIALSLGMVGALSIVRFRNPVRSPLELSVYFGAITMGITASVSIEWLLFFLEALILATLVLFLTSYLSKRFLKRRFFISSFSEGNSLSTLEVTSSNNINILEESVYLKSKSKSSNTIKYMLAASKFKSLRELIPAIEENIDTLSYQLNE